MIVSRPRRLPRPNWTTVEVPHEHLWTGAGLLLIFPYTDGLLDFFSGELHWANLPAYIAWIAVDCLIMALLFRSAGMARAALGFVAATLVLDSGLSVLYAQYYDHPNMSRELYAWLSATLSVGYVALIAAAMWWRLGKNTELFRYVLPVVFSIGVTFLLSLVSGELACSQYHGPPPCAGLDEAPHIQNQFFQLTSEVIPGLLIALAVEARIYTSGGGSAAARAVRGAMFRITVLAFAFGTAASLTVLATGDEQLLDLFELTVQALALGFASIFVLLPGAHDDHGP